MITKTLRATSFATYRDLVGYIRCRDNGGSQGWCLNRGDNGEGAWGHTTAQRHTPMVALNKHLLREVYGDLRSAKGRRVKVTVYDHPPFHAIIEDLAPTGVIDLNPAALIAAGLPEDTELSEAAVVEFTP